MAIEVSLEIRRLCALVAQFGPEGVAASMGVEEEFVFALMSGGGVFDADTLEQLDVVCKSVSDVVDWSKGDGAAVFVTGAVTDDVEEVGAEGFESMPDPDGDGEEVADGVRYNPIPGRVAEYAELAEGSGVVLPAPGETAGEQWGRQLNNLWAARDLALMTQFAIGVEEMDMLYALGLVNEIELALIMMFRQSVPERGRRWDEYRRQKEIYVRMVRKNRIQRNLRKERSGLKGLVSRVKGEKPLSARDMFDRLMVYVDDMNYVMDEGKVTERLTRGVREFMEGGLMGGD